LPRRAPPRLTPNQAARLGKEPADRIILFLTKTPCLPRLQRGFRLIDDQHTTTPLAVGDFSTQSLTRNLLIANNLSVRFAAVVHSGGLARGAAALAGLYRPHRSAGATDLSPESAWPPRSL